MMTYLTPSPRIGTMAHLTPNIGTSSCSLGKSVTVILLRIHPHLLMSGSHPLNKQSKSSEVNFIAVTTLLSIIGSYLRLRDHLLGGVPQPNNLPHNLPEHTPQVVPEAPTQVTSPVPTASPEPLPPLDHDPPQEDNKNEDE
jgi:hypothetical protein